MQTRTNKFQQYGKAFKITRNTILAIAIVLCIVTPGTNWLIPFLKKVIKTGIVFRW